MPDPSDVRPTSHARHDPLVVAALAAGDLAGTDRDDATTLIQTCADCATLHDDLIAIARATASVPPPIVARPRDFRLTPEQAARLRPSGWRRAVGAFASPRLAFTRPLAIGLTTIGLAGLLLTNIPLGFGLGSASSAAAPPNVPGAQGVSRDAGSEAGPVASGTESDRLGAVAVPAASGGPAPAPSAAAGLASAAASAGPVPVSDSSGATAGPAAAGSPKTAFTGGAAGSAAPSAASAPTVGPVSPTFGASSPVEPAPPQDLRTIVFVAVVLVGLGLLVLRRIARRATAP
jgi:hypothetical protein